VKGVKSFSLPRISVWKMVRRVWYPFNSDQDVAITAVDLRVSERPFPVIPEFESGSVVSKFNLGKHRLKAYEQLTDLTSDWPIILLGSNLRSQKFFSSADRRFYFKGTHGVNDTLLP
jgi:hypothetical protein